MKFDCLPPNLGEPWSNFEEGQWYHPSWINLDYVERIYNLANNTLGNTLVRNMRKD